MAPHVGDAAPAAHVSEPVVKGEAKDGTSDENTQGGSQRFCEGIGKRSRADV